MLGSSHTYHYQKTWSGKRKFYTITIFQDLNSQLDVGFKMFPPFVLFLIRGKALAKVKVTCTKITLLKYHIMECKLFIESLSVVECFKYNPKMFKLKFAYLIKAKVIAKSTQ